MKIDKNTRARWSKYIHLFLREHGKTTQDITTRVDAWSIAHALDIPREAYHLDRAVNDRHIETALLRIFTNIPN